MAKEKKHTEKDSRKSQAGFLYLFAALARRASQEKGVTELQRLSGLIEAEITALQNNKNRMRLRDVIRNRKSPLSRIE